MYNNKTVFGLICARGGSKGIPRKNIKYLGGKPLIAWTIEAALASKYIDKLIISSEDIEILNIAKEYGCEAPFVRPLELGLDDTPAMDPIIHAVQQMKSFDYVINLQPTSPLRTTEDIDKAIEICLDEDQKFLVSVCESDKHPIWMYFLEKKSLKPVINNTDPNIRRQDVEPCYSLNGAIYIGPCQNLLKTNSFLSPETLAYIMPKSRSVDLDDQLDFDFCSYLLSKG
ncbi:MAG: acylneuraminate cytidylyltransferase family protein [Cyclobacteriaceae bacterium]